MINFLCNFSAVVLLRSSVGDMEKHINHLLDSPSGSYKGFSVEKLKHAANWGAAIWPDRTSRQVAGHLTIGQGGPSSRAANKFPEKFSSSSFAVLGLIQGTNLNWTTDWTMGLPGSCAARLGPLAFARSPFARYCAS